MYNTFFIEEDMFFERNINTLLNESFEELYNESFMDNTVFRNAKAMKDKITRSISNFTTYDKKRKAKYKELTGRDIDRDIKNLPMMKKFKSKVQKAYNDYNKSSQTDNDKIKFAKIVYTIFFKQIDDIRNNLDMEWSNGKYTDALSYSIGLFSLVTFINSMAVIIFTLLFIPLFGPAAETAGFAALAILIAPVVEEWAKKFAIENGFGETYINVFSIGELVTYLMKVPGGFNPIFFLMRFIVLLFHRSTYKLMKLKSTEKNGRVKVDDSAFISSILAHGIGNAFATFGDQLMGSDVGGVFLKLSYDMMHFASTSIMTAVSDIKEYNSTISKKMTNGFSF